MNIRFRPWRDRLNVTVSKFHRLDGNKHIASFGSIQTPLTVAGRVAFWERVRERLVRFHDRLDAAARKKIIAAIQARIPVVTAAERLAAEAAVTERLRKVEDRQDDDGALLAEYLASKVNGANLSRR